MLKEKCHPISRADSLFFEAKALYDRGSYRDSSPRFQLLALFYPKKADYWIALAHSQKMDREFPQALSTYKVVFDLFPHKVTEDLLCQVADCHRLLGNQTLALSCIQEAIKKAPPEKKASLQFILQQWRQPHVVRR